ncbi:MAG: N-6 DNA methylase [Prevotellaceae bacterium]|nr:N-6 DNA methylase [Prevotellaceae bacterium]
MRDARQEAAKEFARKWQGQGSERAQCQPFWLELLGRVYGVEDPAGYIEFEKGVAKIDHTSFIDGYIPKTRVMIEQKGIDKDLGAPIRQSDGSLLTPYQQARRYIVDLPVDQHPRYVVTSNFREFWVYDMNRPAGDPEKILLKNLPREYYRLDFLVSNEKESLERQLEVSVKAGELVGRIYDAFHKQYLQPDSPRSLHSLNVLCVRLVFCLWAEDDVGIFGRRDIFHDYLYPKVVNDCRGALMRLFRVLDTPERERDPYLRQEGLIGEFPYVNGGLFRDQSVEIPPFDTSIKELLLRDASLRFDWSEINPTIFGALFESTLNPETRRSGGMHYTSVENIHKVIDPLFLSQLRAELREIRNTATQTARQRRALQFQDKLSRLTFLDPACGSGNFLTETYISLRRLENEALRIILGEGQTTFQTEGYQPVRVSLRQFHGIEINDFAVSVAKTALWIAEMQTLHETERILKRDLEFLPLKSNTNIREGNALRIDWRDVIQPEKLTYIIGNPPFAGKKEQSREQKADLMSLYGKGISGIGNMDYVTCWYIKAAEYMQGTNIQAAFVSTNSITQGEQPSVLSKKLAQNNVSIHFAHRTFRWDSEASSRAHVHCVIIGFRTSPSPYPKFIYTDGVPKAVHNINFYLLDAPNVIITTRKKPLCDVPPMSYGSMPIDKNNLILDEEAVQKLLRENADNIQFIREYVGGDELLNGTKRWCLWLVDIDPQLYLKSKFIMRRIADNRNFRLYGSTRPQTNKAADTPQLFGEIRQPENGALVIPKVSSKERRYIPISYVKPGIIINGSALVIPNANLYHFGVLSSNVHNAWMRVVAGRMKSDYQYSAEIVYNNFPWPKATEEQMAAISETAQGILDARERHSNVTLANLYNENNFILFSDLRTAHQRNDKAVMAAYGWLPGSPAYQSETACVSQLMLMYQQLTKRQQQP